MLRLVGSVIVGYLSMFVVVFALLTIGYLALGAERAFKPGVYDVTAGWLVLMLIVSLVAALIGGKVCVLVGKSSRAVFALAGLVLILGLLSAIPALAASGDEPKPRAGAVSNSEAMTNAKQPVWVALLMPVLGVAGVLVGGRQKCAAASA